MTYGANDPNWMDAEPVREHVRFLSAHGIGQVRICRLAGVSPWGFKYLMYGAATRGYPPSQRIRADRARRIMSVSLDLDLVAARARVDATITRRKLEALVAMGWTKSALGARLGIARENTGMLFLRGEVSGHRARQVRDLFNELWDKRPDRRDGYYYRQLRHAERHGYVTALAWNDIEDLSEPQPKPYPLYRRNNYHTRTDALADVRFLRAFGESESEISKRVHISPNRLKEYA